MSSLRFLHCADTHLDSPLRGLERYEGAPVEEIRGASRRAFDNLVSLAIEEGVAFVLIAGDLYDGDWKDYNTGLFFSRQMVRLSEAGIRAFVIAGNHDAASQITKVLRPPDNVRMFSTRAPESVVIDELGVAIHGQGFASRAVTDDLARHYPLASPGLFNIGLLHTSLEGRPGHESYAPCTLDGLRSRGYQYWALGHVHQHEVVTKAPWVVFPGNTQGRHVRETGAKGCVVVEVEDGQVCRLEHRAVDVVRWAAPAVDLTQCSTLDDVFDSVAAALVETVDAAQGRLAAVRLRLVGATPAHPALRAARERVVNECRAIAESVARGAVWLEKVAFHTRQTGSAEAAFARDDAFGELLRSIQGLGADAERLGALRDEVAELYARLPLELRSGDEPLDVSDHDFLENMLEDVRELLLDRLLSRGDAE